MRTRLTTLLLFLAAALHAETISSPDGKIQADISLNDGKAFYSVTLDGKVFLEPSRLGFTTSIGDFSQKLQLTGSHRETIDEEYSLKNAKASSIHYQANALTLDLTNGDGRKMNIELRVSDRDIAYRYFLPEQDNVWSFLITAETSSYKFPQATTTFLCPMSKAMGGWQRTWPSYETEYTADAPMDTPSLDGCGFSFPCLFRIGDDGWALASETGVTSAYCASHLSDYDPEQGYTVSFPQAEQNNGFGSPFVAAHVPCHTPWRTLTIGQTLQPLMETTVPFDLVKPMYQPSQDYKPGRYTWSWLILDDPGTIYEEQVNFIDLAATMGYEYFLVDDLWDKQIGRERIADLSKYAQSKGVSLLLWYNSNGGENDAPQSPFNCMNTSIARHREMKWLQEIGVKGIKVDFFGGDKQETMRLYEDILADANEYGLQVIFHGCTLPRGWERMYPNFVACEAVLASENLKFKQHHCDREGFELTMHPFCRNTVASMDWGGVIMNKRMGRDNLSGNCRRTSDLFEMATGITNQSFVNCVAIQPNNLQELPQLELDFLKTLPTQWDETRFIDGYPSRYVVMARRHGSTWYVAGLNGTSEPLKLELSLPMFQGKTIKAYMDKPAKKGNLPECYVKELKTNREDRLKVTLQPMGGLIITDK